MSTGTLMLAWMLAASPAPGDVYYLNQHQLRIPISVDPARRAEIKELILFMSSDEGKTWHEQAVASPDQDAFPFYAPKDGMYWFSVCVINQQNKREPPDPLAVPPNQKILIDTLKPVVRIKSAERQGEDVVVNWEVQEDHPDWATLKLEYRPADAPAGPWYPVTVTPGAGQTRFRVLQPGPVALRMQLQDLAGNAGGTDFEVAAGVATAAAGSQFASAATAPVTLVNAATPAAPPSPSAGQAAAPASIASGTGWEPPHGAPPTPGARGEPRPTVDSVPAPAPAANNQPVFPPVDNTRLVAASTGNVPIPSSPGGGSPLPGHGPLPPLQMVSNKQVVIDYEVTHHGPSGIGRVELWMTPDDGKTWEKYTQTENINPPLTVELREDGIYGFRLVLQSKAGLQKPPPVSGELPEMRLELDTTPPVAQLFQPELDAKQADALVLTWTATDRNLAANPITLQWTDQPGKEWQTIVTDWPNDGHYSWKLPKTIPYLVYLRLVVRDTAGNTSTAETPKPVCVDLVKPEGHLKGIVSAKPPPAAGAEPPRRIERPNELKGTDLPLSLEHGK
jgi:hypothetical protein